MPSRLLAEKQLDVADPSDYLVRGCVRRHLNEHRTEHRLGDHVCLPGGMVALPRMCRGRRAIYWFRAKGLISSGCLTT